MDNSKTKKKKKNPNFRDKRKPDYSAEQFQRPNFIIESRKTRNSKEDSKLVFPVIKEGLQVPDPNDPIFTLRYIGPIVHPSNFEQTDGTYQKNLKIYFALFAGEDGILRQTFTVKHLFYVDSFKSVYVQYSEFRVLAFRLEYVPTVTSTAPQMPLVWSCESPDTTQITSYQNGADRSNSDLRSSSDHHKMNYRGEGRALCFVPISSIVDTSVMQVFGEGFVPCQRVGSCVVTYLVEFCGESGFMCQN